MPRSRPGRSDTPSRSAKQLTRRNNREGDARVQAAREATDKARAELEELMSQPREGAVAGAIFTAAKKKLRDAEVNQQAVETDAAVESTLQVKIVTLPKTGTGGKGWTKGQARAMLMQGYTLEAVVKRTGFGTEDFDDIRLEDGRGVSREEWMQDQEEKAARLERQGRSLTR